MTYKPGKDIPVADALSRLPTDEIQNNNTVPIPGETVMFLEHLDTTPVTSQKIATWTKRDTVLSQVLDMTRRGIFPQHPSDDLKPYVTRKNDLSIQDDVLLWGNRVIIPPPERQILLEKLHQTHPGIVRMKSLARTIIWWPKMDADCRH